MNAEEIKNLIAETLNTELPRVVKETMATFSAHFENELNTLAETVQTELEATKATTTTSETAADSQDPLAKRLQKLEKQLQEAQEREAVRLKEAQELKFSQKLSECLDSKGNVIHKGIVAELLRNRLKDCQERDGEWYSKDGSKLSEVVSGFFESPEGQHFIPASPSSGTGTPVYRMPAKSGNTEPTLDDMFAEMTF